MSPNPNPRSFARRISRVVEHSADRSRTLQHLLRLSSRLQCTSSFQEALSIHRNAEFAIVEWGGKDVDVCNRGAELRLRAQRLLGQMLSRMQLRGGDRRSQDRGQRVALSDLGVKRDQSRRWQQQGRIQAPVFDCYLARCSSRQKAATVSGLMKFASSQTSDAAPLKVTADSAQHVEQPASSDIAAFEAKELINHLDAIDEALEALYASGEIRLTPVQARVLGRRMREAIELAKGVRNAGASTATQNTNIH